MTERKKRRPRQHIPPKHPKPPKPEAPPFEDPMMLACIDMIGHTGAENVQIRYSDDEEPVVWMAVATYLRDGQKVPQVVAAFHPTVAMFKLCEELMDGGHCQHCNRPTGITADFDPMPLEALVCWYQYDPELKKFRRACEGETS